MTSNDMLTRAMQAGRAVPAFNIPYLPMMKAVVDAVRDRECAAMIAVARLEWMKFESKSIQAVFEEYEKVKDERFTRLHLDHVPVIDEDNLRVDFKADIQTALDLGYGSVMVDGSRLPLDENIAAAREVADMAHAKGAAVEAELGAVMGHEEGPLPPYEELFASGKGFTDPDEAKRFVEESQVDWLSVAAGSVHGAISKAAKGEKKLAAKLNIEHIAKLRDITGVPLVLHGGSGIPKDYIMRAIRAGIAKINIGTAIRQPYEQAMESDPDSAYRAVYDATVHVIDEDLEQAGSARDIMQ